MIRFVNAKINLGLHVVSRRPDGYHNLSTCFYPVGKYAGTPSDSGILADVLEIVPAEKFSLTVTGDAPDCEPHSNLVWKALELFRAEHSALPPVAIYLYKHLPSQAGLGGGSADASFTLKMLNELCGETFTDAELIGMAVRLGADCPFFILNEPCLAAGVGEELIPIDLDLSGYWLAVVKPAEGISTAQAFRHVHVGEPEHPLEEILALPVAQWRGRLSNDFEASMFAIYPELASIKSGLYEAGALYASMSGSGSAFYGIFKSEEKAAEACGKCALPYSTVVRL